MVILSPFTLLATAVGLVILNLATTQIVSTFQHLRPSTFGSISGGKWTKYAARLTMAEPGPGMSREQNSSDVTSPRSPITHATKNIAFCVTGQLSRLELDSKIRRIFASNARHSIVEVFLNLDDSPNTNFVFDDGEFDLGPYSRWNQTRLKRYVSRRMQAVLSNGKTSGEYKPTGVHVNYYRQSEMNFTIDREWVRHLNEIDGSLDPTMTVTQALEKRSLLYMNQFSSISSCMDRIEMYEKWSGNQFDLVVRIRDDAYAMDDWIIDDSYLEHNGITTLDCQQWGGLHDMTYVVARVHASHLFQNLLSWRMHRKELLRNIYDEGGRYPHNPERWLLEVVKALNIPVRRASVCEMPLVMVRFSVGRRIVPKENVGDHILGGYYRKTLGLSECRNSSFPPFPQPNDSHAQYKSRKMINLESAVSNYYDSNRNQTYKRYESRTAFIFGQQCDSCQPQWVPKLAKMMQNPLWKFLQQSKMKCFSNSDTVCNDERESQDVFCFQGNQSDQSQNVNHLPSVQIIGAQKAGTTAIAEWLLNGGFVRPLLFNGEPDYFRKEAHFFDLSERYKKGMEFYSKRFQHAEGGQALDATPDTFQFPERVHSTYTSAGGGQLETLKIIVILREPLSRELSLYNHMASYYSEQLTLTEQIAVWTKKVLRLDGSVMTFDEFTRNVTIPALQAKHCYDNPNDCPSGRSSRNGFYEHFLRKWFHLFDRKQILVLSYDELSNNPKRVQERIETFLGRQIQGSLQSRNTRSHKSKVTSAHPETTQVLRTLFAPLNDALYRLLEESPGPPEEQRPFPHFSEEGAESNDTTKERLSIPENNTLLVKQRLPSVQIIGAQKAGTTAIAKWMFDGGFSPSLIFEGEPDYFQKEAHFFDLSERYRRGVEFYNERFQHAEGGQALDATPDTFRFPERVHSTYTSASGGQLETLKIIVILREPVSRELSLYNHMASNSEQMKLSERRTAWTKEVLRLDGSVMTFDEFTRNVTIPALQAKHCYDNPNDCPSGRSSRNGFYEHFLRKWFHLFDRKQILVLSYDELSNNPKRVQERIETFLGRQVPGKLQHRNTKSHKSKVTSAHPETTQVLRTLFAPLNDALYRLLEESPGPPEEQRPFPHFVEDSKQNI